MHRFIIAALFDATDMNTAYICQLVVARFNKYRIPRENMLMRFSKVSKDGVFTKPPHAKVRQLSESIRVQTSMNTF